MARASLRQSNRKLELVADRYGPALCAILSKIRQIWMRNARPARSHVTLSTRRPLPAYSRRLVVRW